MIVFWGEPPGKPLQVPPLTTAPVVPYMIMNTMSIKIQSWPHRQPPCSSLQPDRQTGPEEFKEVGDLQGLVGWGIK